VALKDSLANIPPRQKILLVVLLFLAIVTAFYFLVYRGLATERDSLVGKREALKGELNEKRILAANLERLKSEITLLEADLSKALLVLPEEKEIPSLLRTINSLGLKVGIEFLLFKPGSLTTREFYGELPVQMKVQGTYHALGRFFDSIAKMPRIVNVTDLKISSITPSKESKDTIVAEFLATTFTFTGAKGGKPSGTEKGK
jgi:type IV pilus assembly protein PilO